MKIKDDLEMGAEYKDKITGFKGTLVGFCLYITGCNQALLVPRVKKDGSHQDGHWYDEQRLERVGKKKPVSLDNRRRPGADIPPPLDSSPEGAPRE